MAEDGLSSFACMGFLNSLGFDRLKPQVAGGCADSQGFFFIFEQWY
jgi:hypothetical protein